MSASRQLDLGEKNERVFSATGVDEADEPAVHSCREKAVGDVVR